MTAERRDQERFSALMAELLDGKLADQQIAELQALMRDHESLRAQYFEYVVTHAMLEWRHGIPTAIGAAPVEQRPIGDATESPAGSAAAAASEDSKQSPKSIVLPFRIFGGMTTPYTYPLLVLVFVLVIGSAAIVFHGPSRRAEQEIGVNVPAAAQLKKLANDENTVVARFIAGMDCDWDSTPNPPNIGDALKVGQPLKLASGIAELKFDIGARVVLQSPTTITVDSPKSIRLESGKLAAEITSVEARGFKVLTPDGTFVDQGTEFGIDVPPGGGSRVHVFKGEVDLGLGNQANAKVSPHRLLANSGARIENEASNVTFVEDTGETFVRSLDQTERDLHVLAYWRFEDHPVGTLFPDTNLEREVKVATVDSSFNGNDLYTFFQYTRPYFSEEVPEAIVPQTGRPNRTCLDNTVFPGPVSARDVYTNSIFSHSSPLDIQRVTPEEWSIEASVKVMELEGRTQTFIGREPGTVQAGKSRTPCLAFQITADGHLAIQFKDPLGRMHVATASDYLVEANHWYHVAAVSDAKHLLLFANSIDGHGYRLIAKTALPKEGSTALAGGEVNAAWTLGRGRAQNGVGGQWFKGWIDEVRISDIALDPSVFLFSENKSTRNSGKAANTSKDRSSAVAN